MHGKNIPTPVGLAVIPMMIGVGQVRHDAISGLQFLEIHMTCAQRRKSTATPEASHSRSPLHACVVK